MNSFLIRHVLVTLVRALHIDLMGVVLQFPVRRRVHPAARVARIFAPQEELQAANETATRFFALAVAFTMLVVGGLQLIAH